jgi:hypothetical protein
MVDNADWLCTVSITDFLRDVGKYFTVSSMLAKESVKRRMGGGVEAVAEGEGISFTEFSYMLLQAYDFLELYDRYGCGCRWAAAISGGTSSPASTSSAGCGRPPDADRGPQASKRSARFRPGLPAARQRAGNQVRQDRIGHGVAGRRS